uniref:Ovule protein n=1 Tax=Steinernema glaseri TaxID=37863 RepID=A0A1I7YH55_9BILA
MSMSGPQGRYGMFTSLQQHFNPLSFSNTNENNLLRAYSKPCRIQKAHLIRGCLHSWYLIDTSTALTTNAKFCRKAVKVVIKHKFPQANLTQIISYFWITM